MSDVKKDGLAVRLDAHFAALRVSSTRGALKRQTKNWQVYAAATGSALAMATNASASIIYSNTLITAGPVESIWGSGRTDRTQIIPFGDGGAVGIAVSQHATSPQAHSS